MKVLIIDDSSDALALAKVRLNKENLEIMTASSGAEGLELAKKSLHSGKALEKLKKMIEFSNKAKPKKATPKKKTTTKKPAKKKSAPKKKAAKKKRKK